MNGLLLTGLAEELRTGRYVPGPYRRREIPKEGGKVRVISILELIPFSGVLPAVGGGFQNAEKQAPIPC